MPDKVSADVHVSKGFAQIVVPPNTSAAAMGGIVQKVVTNERVLTAAGLKACGGCKSGLDIHIIDKFQEVIKVEG